MKQDGEKRKAGGEIPDPDDGVPYDRGWAWMVVLGMFVLNAVVERVGVRVTVLAGGFFIGVSAILASFATNLTYLILSQAVLHGKQCLKGF
nr:hypothetical protein BaRGS_000475 [Batillaria attramentaria]